VSCADQNDTAPPLSSGYSGSGEVDRNSPTFGRRYDGVDRCDQFLWVCSRGPPPKIVFVLNLAPP